MTTHAVVTLDGETAVRLTPRGNHSGMDITIQNVNSTGHIYLGGAEVSSTSYGYRLLPNHAWSIELPGDDELWATSEVADMQIAVLKTGLESQN